MATKFISAISNWLPPRENVIYQPLNPADLEASVNESYSESPSSNSEQSGLQPSPDDPNEKDSVANTKSSKWHLYPSIIICSVIGSLLFLLVITLSPQSIPSKSYSDFVKLENGTDQRTGAFKYPDTSIAPVVIYWHQRNEFIDPPADSCPVRVHLTSNRSEAEVVIWPIMWPLPPLKGIKQKNVIFSLENAVYYPVLRDARQSIRKKEGILDYEMTYRLSSDVPIPYAYGFIDLRSPALPYSERKQDKLIAAFISNCKPLNDRNEVLSKMMKLLPGQIDSFGHCERNADASQALAELSKKPGSNINVTQLNDWARKETIIRHYKFTIAFENADEEDYVTEKYYQALSVGSIPLHLGQPGQGGFDKFLPAPNAAINVRDYKTIEDLVNEIKNISTDEERFNKMLSWKDKPFLPFFQQIVDWGKVQDVCRLALLLRGVSSNPYARPALPLKPSKSHDKGA
ncbi:hypothetical protein CROQUDRAFT_658454 [Cronartium quercuum f. sp. fusiforme G11]|uniref:Fucosyltransferase n=1 Tax=Cronartium quercuum f. sp. fusiforme G11 TaxID=708437 RepID=A0A9P6NL28_9BASI|nr:hypothetical protein CROQUDRAFT_658454 [Cronartium quercuum f. sp. fusiforme G11]